MYFHDTKEATPQPHMGLKADTDLASGGGLTVTRERQKFPIMSVKVKVKQEQNGDTVQCLQSLLTDASTEAPLVWKPSARVSAVFYGYDLRTSQ